MLLFILLNLFWKATGEVYSSYENVKHINKIENQLVRKFTTGMAAEMNLVFLKNSLKPSLFVCNCGPNAKRTPFR